MHYENISRIYISNRFHKEICRVDFGGNTCGYFEVGRSEKEKTDYFETNPDVEVALHNMLTEEQRTYIKLFYCQGGLDYDKMKLPSKMAMKAFLSVLKNKKDATEAEKEMASWINHSYDISDKKYIEPIVEYIM